MTEIEIPELGPDGTAGDAGDAPYRNLLVPLLVVPALIVMVLVLVVVLFGAIAGEEATPQENVQRLLNGGANEREQAAFNLVRQVLETWEAEAGGPQAWEIDASLLPQIRSAWEKTKEIDEAGDVPIPLALTIILARAGDSAGVAELARMTRLSDQVDPDGNYRSFAGFALGAIGERLGPVERGVAARALVELLESDDPGLRNVAVIALQTLPSPRTLPALRGMLSASSVELRLNAALSLARLGDAAGADVLREMIHPGPYRAEHKQVRRKWAKELRVSESRRKALEALEELGETPPRAELERLAREDSDPLVREVALRILRRR